MKVLAKDDNMQLDCNGNAIRSEWSAAGVGSWKRHIKTCICLFVQFAEDTGAAENDAIVNSLLNAFSPVSTVQFASCVTCSCVTCSKMSSAQTVYY